jgi:hypothetical protein
MPQEALSSKHGTPATRLPATALKPAQLQAASAVALAASSSVVARISSLVLWYWDLWAMPAKPCIIDGRPRLLCRRLTSHGEGFGSL